MKRFAALLLIILPGLAMGQGDPLFDQLISTSPAKPTLEQTTRLTSFTENHQLQEAKSEKKFLKSIFKATHQQFLKTYSQYADLGEVFTTGRFDCLTGTALLSVVLTENHFDYSIVETKYHIFILVNTSTGQVLLEATDRLSGFVDDPDEINKRIASYRQNKLMNIGDDKTFYQYSFNLFHEVRPDQLAGLLYFNQAIKAFNRHDLLACASLLEQSERIYESPRVEELAIVLVKSVLESNLSAAVKGKVIQQYKSYVFGKNSPVASR